MLFFHAQNLAFLETPKTGSTAICQALAPYASITVSKPPKLRHMRARSFAKHTGPYLKRLTGQDVATFAVMRHPVERLRSWYRYRMGRPHTKAGAKIQGMSFDEYVEAVLSDDPRASGIGSQDKFLCDEDGQHLVTYLFQYDRQDLLKTFLDGRFGQNITFERANPSLSKPVEISQLATRRIEEARGPEMALWQELTKKGVLGLVD